MQGGEIRQFGPPQEIYDRPSDLFVAGFIGSPSMNFIKTEIVAHQDGVGARLQDSQSLLRPWSGKEVILGIRPEQITDSTTAQYSGPDVYSRSFKVELVEPTGPVTLVLVRLNGEVVCCRVRPEQACVAGQSMELLFNLSKAVFFDPATEKRIG